MVLNESRTKDTELTAAEYKIDNNVIVVNRFYIGSKPISDLIAETISTKGFQN